MKTKNMQKSFIVDRFLRSLIELVGCEELDFAKGNARTAMKREIATITKLQHHKTPNQKSNHPQENYTKVRRNSTNESYPVLFASIADFNNIMNRDKSSLICSETHTLPSAIRTSDSILITSLALTK